MQPDESLPLIDALIAGFYAAFDNRHARVPTLEAVLDLFMEMGMVLHAQGGGIATFNAHEFTEPRIRLLGSGELLDFHEWETESRTEVQGEFAIRVSQYAKAGRLHGAAYAGRGTKLFQLARINGAWRIASLCWYDA